MADKKIYRTAGGRVVDMEQLALKNEKVRAVGNMSVNARGDVVDGNNNLTSSRAAQVNKSYRKQTGNVPKDVPVQSSNHQVTEPISGLDEEVNAAPVKPKAKAKPKAKVKADKEPASGLAGAIAKAENKE